MRERCRDGCRTSLLLAGVVLVPAIFHILPPCHPYITMHFMEMIFSTLPKVLPYFVIHTYIIYRLRHTTPTRWFSGYAYLHYIVRALINSLKRDDAGQVPRECVQSSLLTYLSATP